MLADQEVEQNISSLFLEYILKRTLVESFITVKISSVVCSVQFLVYGVTAWELSTNHLANVTLCGEYSREIIL